MKKYICFDVGGTNVKHGILQEDGTIISKSSYRTPTDNLEQFLTKMTETIMSYLKNHQVSGIAVSLPGFINHYTGFSEQAGAVTALKNQNLKSLLEARVPLRVEIENDGNCAAIAEKISGNAKGCDDVICVTIGTGIGGGIFVNGKLLRGQRFRTGEFGFMITQANEHDYGDNWHATASTAALISAYKKLKGGEDQTNGEAVFLHAARSKSVKKLIDSWTRNISYGIFNLAATLNPEKILIGGGVSSQEDLLPAIQRHLDELPWWKDLKVPIERCKHRNDAGMLGAMYHFIQKQQ
ncbi:ROK family protein [Neobacillus niacini]|uniref:ROK family protein n=1 Tax=Neobacillus niacini TaxID=86668 RepID=UPI0021CB03DC|nr:ROK family protein [Neobacillus niacini]MCM3763385.1 ROK family protein [Neobacillus niacini]